MSQVMKECGHQNLATQSCQFPVFVTVLAMAFAKRIQHSPGHVAYPNTVGPSAVLSAGVGQRTQTELTNPSQPLEFWPVDEFDQQFAFVPGQGDQIVYGIPQDFPEGQTTTLIYPQALT